MMKNTDLFRIFQLMTNQIALSDPAENFFKDLYILQSLIFFLGHGHNRGWQTRIRHDHQGPNHADDAEPNPSASPLLHGQRQRDGASLCWRQFPAQAEGC